MNKYIITGNTFDIKDDLKAYGCRWDANLKAWVTKLIEHGSRSHLALTSICKSAGVYMDKVAVTEKAKKIQTILIKGQK